MTINQQIQNFLNDFKKHKKYKLRIAMLINFICRTINNTLNEKDCMIYFKDLVKLCRLSCQINSIKTKYFVSILYNTIKFFQENIHLNQGETKQQFNLERVKFYYTGANIVSIATVLRNLINFNLNIKIKADLFVPTFYHRLEDIGYIIEDYSIKLILLKKSHDLRKQFYIHIKKFKRKKLDYKHFRSLKYLQDRIKNVKKKCQEDSTNIS